MVVLKNWETESAEIEADIAALKVGEELHFDKDIGFRMAGYVYGSEAFVDGTKIQTSRINMVRKTDQELYIAVTDSGKEYCFGFIRHYGVPALNKWSFPENDVDGYWIDLVKSFKHKVDRFNSLHIRGRAVDVDGYADGDTLDLNNVTSLELSEDFPGVIAETADHKKFLLPDDQRIGFYYGAIMMYWHFTFDKHVKKDPDMRKIINGILRKVVDLSRERPSDDTIFEKKDVDIPKEIGMCIKAKRKKPVTIEKIQAISYMGRRRMFLFCESKYDSVIEFNMNYMDWRQKRMFKKIKKRGKI